MKRGVVRAVTAAFVAGSAAIGFAPIALASTDTTLTPSTEAWYQPNPTCLTPAGCVTTGTLPAQPPTQPPAASPYPAGTLHVGVAAGQEDARTYLGFAFGQFSGMTVSAGSLTVPLDVAQADGSVSPETSKIVVCLTSVGLASSEGTIDAPPTIDCSPSVSATYVAVPTPHLQADLGGLAASLPDATGLALLPDASVAQTDAWRVVFSATTRTDAAKAPPATVTLKIEDAVTSGLSDGPVTYPSAPGDAGLTGVTPLVGTGFAAPPAAQPPVTASIAPSVSNPPPAVSSAPRLVTVGYAYPAVWLLPLAFLVLVPAAARALTKDLSVT